MATRRSADPQSRERLLQAGDRLARQGGLRGLTVRAVAAQAQANLGSFVYHFGTRESFLAELIERAYAPLMAGLELSAAAVDDPLDKLQHAVSQLLAWAVGQRQLITQILLDASAGEAAAQRFLRGIDQRHPALLLRLIVSAQRAGRLRDDDPLHLLMFLMTSTAAPLLLLPVIAGSGLAPEPFVRALATLAVDPDRIQQRLAWALRGLAPAPREKQ